MPCNLRYEVIDNTCNKNDYYAEINNLANRNQNNIVFGFFLFLK